MSGGDDTDKMAVMANLDGIEVSDAILKAMEDEALFEREKLARKRHKPLMLPRDVDWATPSPPAPPFGIPQDVRYQFNYPKAKGLQCDTAVSSTDDDRSTGAGSEGFYGLRTEGTHEQYYD